MSLQNRTIFIDMDGVVADFDAYAQSILGYSTTGGKRYPLEDWAKISANPRFYYELETCRFADVLVDACLELSNDVKFLTAIPRANDVPWSFTDKVLWAQERWPNIPVWFGPYSHDKHLHCSPGDVLIDDRDDNINDWNRAGGIGILHQNNIAETIVELRKIANG
jgi:5'(3')-deoxyribonucleotidase